MNVPFRWLLNYVSTNIDPAELARRMTMAGLEAEQLTRIGDSWNNVFVGEVMAVSPHPDADRLVLAEVVAGEHHLTVVTGAPNIEAGQKVALALAGARLIDGYSDELKYKTLKPGSIRGIRSEGMVCSEKELGLSDEHDGILVLEPDAPVGVPLRDYLGDTVIEFEITPNLIHAFSIFGIAREAGAVIDAPVTPPEIADLTGVPIATDSVRIDAPDLCKRYSGIVIDGVRVEPSPAWLARRLTHAGVRPVNNLVDITNYVMLELGQPLHAFDLSYLHGEQIIVRTATAGEEMETLDHRIRKLSGGELLICDGIKPVALAGIMGGVNSEIVDSTTSILLEAANFDMVTTRGTARAQKLQTDASARFGRGLDPELAGVANARAARLVLELCPGASIRWMQDVYPSPPESRSLEVPVAAIETILGMAIETPVIMSILSRLEFSPQLAQTGESLNVTIPSWRSDVSIKEDIVEEIARIVGYENLPATLIEGTSPLIERDAEYLAEQRIRHLLVAAGAYEGRGYVTMSQADVDRWGLLEHGGLGHLLADIRLVRLRNAIPAQDDILRPSILPRLTASVAENLKHDRTVRLFEVGHVYLGSAPNELPNEPSTLGIVYAGHREPFDRFNARPDASHQLDYFDVRGVIDVLLDQFGLGNAEFRSWAHPAFHPSRAAEIVWQDERLGIIGELHPALAADLGIEDLRVPVAELHLRRIFELSQTVRPCEIKVQRFLPVEQDFAVIVDHDTPASTVQEALIQSAGPLLTDITLFDIFEGSQIGDGRKSLAYRLTFTAPDRALTDAELGKVRKRIERGLKMHVDGTLRT